jgi:hypothetical protein
MKSIDNAVTINFAITHMKYAVLLKFGGNMLFVDIWSQRTCFSKGKDLQ